MLLECFGPFFYHFRCNALATPQTWYCFWFRSMIAAAAPNIKFSKDVSWLRIQITQQWAASDHLRKMTKSFLVGNSRSEFWTQSRICRQSIRCSQIASHENEKRKGRHHQMWLAQNQKRRYGGQGKRWETHLQDWAANNGSDIHIVLFSHDLDSLVRHFYDNKADQARKVRLDKIKIGYWLVVVFQLVPIKNSWIKLRWILVGYIPTISITFPSISQL